MNDDRDICCKAIIPLLLHCGQKFIKKLHIFHNHVKNCEFRKKKYFYFFFLVHFFIFFSTVKTCTSSTTKPSILKRHNFFFFLKDECQYFISKLFFHEMGPIQILLNVIRQKSTVPKNFYKRSSEITTSLSFENRN